MNNFSSLILEKINPNGPNAFYKGVKYQMYFDKLFLRMGSLTIWKMAGLVYIKVTV